VSTTLVLLETWSIHFLFYLTVGTQADVCKAYGVIHAATAFLRVWGVDNSADGVFTLP
jgi:hypothetical protein